MGVYTRTQISNVIFNEIGSITGPGINLAYYYYAHTILNSSIAKATQGIPLPTMGSPELTKAKGSKYLLENKDDYRIYSRISAIVAKAYSDRANGINPIPGARFFTNRDSLDLTPQDFSRGKWPTVEAAVVFGPFSNKFANADTPWTTGGYLYIWYDEATTTRIRNGALE